MQLLYNPNMRSLQFEVKDTASVLLPWCVVRAQDIPNLDVFKTLAAEESLHAVT